MSPATYPTTSHSTAGQDLPYHSHVHSVADGEALEALRRVLRAYALYNPAVGYCQGMNFVAGTLLLVCEEQEAFWLLAYVIEEVLPKAYLPSMMGLICDQEILAMLLQQHEPEIAQHMTSIGLPMQMWVTGWLITLMQGSLCT